MRSMLFVPGDSVRKFESARKTAADCLILDLEDSVAPDQKVSARSIVVSMLKQNDGRLSAAARALGISRKGLYLKRQRYRL